MKELKYAYKITFEENINTLQLGYLIAAFKYIQIYRASRYDPVLEFRLCNFTNHFFQCLKHFQIPENYLTSV